MNPDLDRRMLALSHAETNLGPVPGWDFSVVLDAIGRVRGRPGELVEFADLPRRLQGQIAGAEHAYLELGAPAATGRPGLGPG